MDWNDAFSLTVEIDHSVLTTEMLHQINDFFSNSDDRLEEADGNVLIAVLKMLFKTFMYFSFDHVDAINAFQSDTPEGFIYFNGKYGANLISYSDLDIDAWNIDVSLKEGV